MNIFLLNIPVQAVHVVLNHTWCQSRTIKTFCFLHIFSYWSMDEKCLWFVLLLYQSLFEGH